MFPAAGPARALAAATFVDTIGKGLSLTAGVLFLVRVADLPVAQIGAGLTAAGLAGLAGGVVIGDRADRLGARRVYLATLGVQVVGALVLAATRSVPLFLISAVLSAVGQQGARSSRGALIALISPPGGRSVLLAQLRSITNVGISLGALVAGVAVAFDTTTSYTAIVLADAATFALAGAIVFGRIAPVAPTRTARAGGRHWVALADGAYLSVAAVNAVASLHGRVLTVGLPLWVSAGTDAPPWVVAPLLLVNTVAIVVLQMRAARGVTTPAAGARALRRSGAAFAVAWSLTGLAGGGAVWLAVALLVLGVAVHSVGELWQAAAEFELSFALARADAQGQYQGVFGIGHGLADAVAPVLVTSVCVAGGFAGWAALGAAVAVLCSLAPAVVARAERTGVRLAAQPG